MLRYCSHRSVSDRPASVSAILAPLLHTLPYSLYAESTDTSFSNLGFPFNLANDHLVTSRWKHGTVRYFRFDTFKHPLKLTCSLTVLVHPATASVSDSASIMLKNLRLINVYIIIIIIITHPAVRSKMRPWNLPLSTFHLPGTFSTLDYWYHPATILPAANPR